MSEIRFSVLTYERCWKDFISFRNANRDNDRDEAYFEWRFLKRPSSLKPLFVWAETFAGEKIGSLSLAAHDYLVDGMLSPMGILGDISVSRQWRGRGVAKQMFDYMAGLDALRSLKACVVLPNIDAAKPLEKAGWQTVSRLERYVKILRSEDTLARALKRKSSGRVLSHLVDTAFKLSSGEVFMRDTTGYEGRPVNRFDDRFDDLWGSFNKKDLALGIRNMAYLTWRYSSHPLTKYGIFTLTHGGRLCGYMVFNISGNTCQVADILCMSENRYPDHLLYFFIKHMRKRGIASITLGMNGSDISYPLRKFGFIRRPDGQHFMVSPGCSELSLDGSKWYITSGDKDV